MTRRLRSHNRRHPPSVRFFSWQAKSGHTLVDEICYRSSLYEHMTASCTKKCAIYLTTMWKHGRFHQDSTGDLVGVCAHCKQCPLQCLHSKTCMHTAMSMDATWHCVKVSTMSLYLRVS